MGLANSKAIVEARGGRASELPVSCGIDRFFTSVCRSRDEDVSAG
jgi:hypothetical protein